MKTCFEKDRNHPSLSHVIFSPRVYKYISNKPKNSKILIRKINPSQLFSRRIIHNGGLSILDNDYIYKTPRYIHLGRCGIMTLEWNGIDLIWLCPNRMTDKRKKTESEESDAHKLP